MANRAGAGVTGFKELEAGFQAWGPASVDPGSWAEFQARPPLLEQSAAIQWD